LTAVVHLLAAPHVYRIISNYHIKSAIFQPLLCGR
jgi:hypothetical protein